MAPKKSTKKEKEDKYGTTKLNTLANSKMENNQEKEKLYIQISRFT
mgnify:CR=1 FL=1